MAYTTGSAADMDAVKSALVNACVADGWISETDGDGATVISKNGIYVRIGIGQSNRNSSIEVLELLGRTSLNAGDAPEAVGMRPIYGEAIPFPVTYHAFTFTDEVYFVISYLDRFQWVAFGQSDQAGLPGTGNWISASCSEYDPYEGIRTSSEPNFSGMWAVKCTSAAIFWSGSPATYEHRNYWIHSAIDASEWRCTVDGDDHGKTVGAYYLTSLLDALPNDFNAESVLLPIRAYKTRPSSKFSQVAELKNARHMRVDHYSDGEIIQLGTERWMTFPHYRKNISARDGGSRINHTGTFGWAIRYEGP